MIVYVESNFVLELVRLQNEAEACAEILGLAKEGRIRLVLPAFSAAEPFDVLRRSSADRQRLQAELDRQLRLLGRTTTFATQLARAAEVTALLTESTRVETERLHDVLAEILGLAEVIPITAATLQGARDAQRALGLRLQDSVVYTSVLTHARSAGEERKCFLERDAKDFLTPDIEEALQGHDCRIITSFAGGLGFIREQIHA
ncbi:MAG: hypothetical protein ACJ8J0_23515 [Longimicrobiaceae bacterium]